MDLHYLQELNGGNPVKIDKQSVITEFSGNVKVMEKLNLSYMAF